MPPTVRPEASMQIRVVRARSTRERVDFVEEIRSARSLARRGRDSRGHGGGRRRNWRVVRRKARPSDATVWQARSVAPLFRLVYRPRRRPL